MLVNTATNNDRHVPAFTLQDLAHGLRELLAYEGNVEEDLCTDFQVNLKASWTLFNFCVGAGVAIAA